MITTKLERQEFAYTKVKLVTTSRKEYKSSVESLGMFIYKNGLISTLAVLRHKNNTLYNHIKEWLLPDENDLLTYLVGLNSIKLMMVTQEALLFSDALKEFAKAEIE